MRVSEHDDDTTLRDFAAWQRWQRDTTPIEYWHSLDLSERAYLREQERHDKEEDA